jgi:hypothetical protein
MSANDPIYIQHIKTGTVAFMLLEFAKSIQPFLREKASEDPYRALRFLDACDKVILTAENVLPKGSK